MHYKNMLNIILILVLQPYLVAAERYGRQRFEARAAACDEKGGGNELHFDFNFRLGSGGRSRQRGQRVNRITV
jgi:hypothetical protein